MMQAKSMKKTSRNPYTPEFHQQAQAECIGVAKAARELSLHDYKLRLVQLITSAGLHL
ncbi:hypothetical protein [Rahnella sp. RcJ3]|jgi:transposase|uniref:hypothetical protein n=1 Tax=Rahnella sp. RcJ3 TaxID=2292446 RepID=UPI0012948890|nr:hypothetical protein [Rahnella sp. RcJ3]